VDLEADVVVVNHKTAGVTPVPVVSFAVAEATAADADNCKLNISLLTEG
jgi:hypothetical protein